MRLVLVSRSCHKSAACLVLAVERDMGGGTMERYVVVGGGLAGLTAANALAAEGRKVVLLEQSEQLGGRAKTKQDHGYPSNLGPPALHQCGLAAQTLREWGV